MNFPHGIATSGWARLAGELSFLSLTQVTSNLPNLGLHLGNCLGVHHGSILHVIDRMAYKLHEGLERVFQSLTVRLALECVLDMSVLAELNDHETQWGIGFENDEGLFPSPWVGFASTKNLGGSSTQDCRTRRKVLVLASYSR
jgi:hypothetical protein